MATFPRWRARQKEIPSSPALRAERFAFIGSEDGTHLLDMQARKYLGMGGDEFARRYREGRIDDPERPEVARVALLLPAAQQAERAQEE